MNRSESITNLAKALAAAQGMMSGAKKDKTNPHFKSAYADLASVIDAAREPLSTNGLAFVQVTEPSEHDEVRVETVLMHDTGEWLSGTVALPVSKADAQGFGSALTYAKRYGLQSLLGIPSEDDDGNAATSNVGRRAEQRDEKAALAAARRDSQMKTAEFQAADFELTFVEATTLPDLASRFDAAQKAIRAFAPEIGADGVKPILDRLIAAKESRKAAIQAGAHNPEAVESKGSKKEKVAA